MNRTVPDSGTKGGTETESPFVGRPKKEGQMKEDLKRIIDELDEEDIYLLYVTALEMRRR